MVTRDLMYFPIKWSAKEPQESSKSQGSQGPHNIRVSIGVFNIPQVEIPHVASPLVDFFLLPGWLEVAHMSSEKSWEFKVPPQSYSPKK